MTEEMAVEKAQQPKVPMAREGSLFFNVALFQHIQRVAQVFASSTMVPAHFQNNIPNCVIALNLADRMQVDPFMLFQNMYVVHGNPGIEAKLAIALINGCGRFEPLEYTHKNKGGGDDWECISHAKELRSGKVLESATVSIKMAKDEGWYNKSGSKWKTMPELMLMYRSAMFFARVYCPEVLLGLKTREELYDIVDMERNQTGEYVSQEQKAKDLTTEIKNGVKPVKEADYTPQEVPGPDIPEERDAVSEDSLFDQIKKARPSKSEKTMAAYIKLHEDNADAIRALPKPDYEYATKKWHRACPGELFLARPLTEDEQQEDVPKIGTPIEVPPQATEVKNGGYDVQARMDFLEKMAEFKKMEEGIESLPYTTFMNDVGYKKSGDVTPEKHKEVLDSLTTIFKAL